LPAVGQEEAVTLCNSFYSYSGGGKSSADRTTWEAIWNKITHSV